MIWVLTGSLVRWGLRVVLSCGREIPRGRLSSEEVFVRSTDTSNSWVSRESHTLVYHRPLPSPLDLNLCPYVTLTTEGALKCSSYFASSIPDAVKYLFFLQAENIGTLTLGS